MLERPTGKSTRSDTASAAKATVAEGGRGWGAWLRTLLQEDRAVTRLALVYALLQVWACLWDLPGDHGWENDGIAPRGVFSGLAGNLTPGSAHQYPLLHYVIALLASLPALLLVPVLSPSLGFKDLASSASSTAVMTGVSLCVKLATVVMSVLTLLLLARYARRTDHPRAGYWAAVFFAVNLSLFYYGRTSNLDVPYLMWAALALDRFARLDATVRPGRDLALLGAFSAAAMATKDQAYAIVFPLLGLAALRLLWARDVRLVLRLGAGFVGSYALLSGALFNPTGFLARVRLLTGPNSQDYKGYESSWLGLWRNVLDLAAGLSEWWWPWPVLVLSAVGVIVGLSHTMRSKRLAQGVPLLMALGCLGLFTLVVRRAEHRFLLPCAFAASYYAGLGANTFLRFTYLRSSTRAVTTGLLFVSAATAALPCAALVATQWLDGRRAVTTWLARQPRGTRVETYGLPVYLPHFDTGEDAPYRVERLQPTGKAFAPLRGIASSAGSYAEVDQRNPDVLIIPEGFASRYLPKALAPGQRLSRLEEMTRRESDPVRFFEEATAGALPGYKLAWIAQPALPHWMRALGFEPVRVHGSTGMRTWVLTREGGESVP